VNAIVRLGRNSRRHFSRSLIVKRDETRGNLLIPSLSYFAPAGVTVMHT
jgi:hypothetical protein